MLFLAKYTSSILIREVMVSGQLRRYYFRIPVFNRRVLHLGLTSARYLVVESTDLSASVIAEVDLVNNQGIGIPAIFTRRIRIEPG